MSRDLGIGDPRGYHKFYLPLKVIFFKQNYFGSMGWNKQMKNLEHFQQTQQKN